MSFSTDPSVSGSKHDLVSFDSPPVNEVVLSVQFAPGTFDLEAFGLFAQAVHEDMPTRQHHPVLPAIQEAFDQPVLHSPIEIRLEAVAALPRTLFLSRDGSYVAQLQHDRLTLNWRENGTGAEYPRYSRIRDRFQPMLEVLWKSLHDTASGFRANLCEVAYVNPIAQPTPGEEGRAQLAHIVNRIGPRPPKAFLPNAEDAQLAIRWRIPGSELDDSQDGPAGRLYLQARPGVRPPELKPIYVINLTAHVLTTAEAVEGVLAAMDVAHKWVVLGFKDITTKEMHQVWGLKEDVE